MSHVTDGSLYSALARLPDARKARGKLYPLPALLTMTVAAMLCGCKALAAVAQWGRDYNHLLGLLGFTKRKGQRYRSPCVGELSTVYAALDADAFEEALRRWLRAGSAGGVLAVDGKRLRGTRDGAVPGVHLVSAFDRDARTALAQVPVGDTSEAKAALVLLKLIPLGGAVVTGDAAFTHRDFCEKVVAGGGDYFLPVKDNQPDLKEAIAAGFARAFSPRERGERRAADDLAEATNKGHGRVESRRLRSSPRLREYLKWPGLEQVCVLERTRRVGGAAQKETVFAITSLTPGEASARRLLDLSRGHWGIENRLHWVKDVVLGEDACRVRGGRGPQVLSGLRNAALRLLHGNGLGKIASALRHLAAFPMKAVQLVTQGRITDL
jgi:predicted transposase YbfD/YdcC